MSGMGSHPAQEEIVDRAHEAVQAAGGRESRTAGTARGSENPMIEKIPTAFGMVTPAVDPSPSDWMAQATRQMLDNMLAAQDEQLRRSFIFTGQDPDNRPTIMEQRDLSPEYLAARKKFKKRWKRLAKRGVKAGWLEHDYCNECGGELHVTKTTTEWVTVPNPDYDPDKPNPYARTDGDTVTIPIARRTDV